MEKNEPETKCETCKSSSQCIDDDKGSFQYECDENGVWDINSKTECDEHCDKTLGKCNKPNEPDEPDDCSDGEVRCINGIIFKCPNGKQEKTVIPCNEACSKGSTQCVTDDDGSFEYSCSDKAGNYVNLVLLQPCIGVSCNADNTKCGVCRDGDTKNLYYYNNNPVILNCEQGEWITPDCNISKACEIIDISTQKFKNYKCEIKGDHGVWNATDCKDNCKINISACD